MSDEHGPAAPAGWYPTPDGGQRYWDGAQWLELPAPDTAVATEPVQDETRAPAAASPAKKGHADKIIIATIAVIAIVGLVAFLVSRSKSSPDASIQAAYTSCAPDTSKSASGDSGVHLEDNGATLTIDTKGNKDITGADIVDLACVLVFTKAPASVTAQIDATRALDGTQTASWNGIHATWRYHPDSGVNLVLTTNAG